MAMAITRGPNRPVYIMRTSMNLPHAERFGVTPILKPTVPNAEVVSKSISRNSPLLALKGVSPASETSRQAVPRITMTTEMTKMANARLMVPEDMDLLNACTCPEPVMRALLKASKTPRLLVLMPPPVEPGDAPMNMNIIVPKRVILFMALKSRVLNPAVRGVTN